MEVRLTERQNQAVKIMTGSKYSLLFGGARSGKTFIALLLVVYRAIQTKSRHAVLRFRFSHVKQSVVYDTFPKVCELLGIKYELNKSDWFAKFPNGSEIWFGGLDDKERTDKILGNEYSTIFLNEASQISYDSYLTVLTRLAEKALPHVRMILDENPPSKAHWTYKLFIEGIEPQTKSSIDTSLYSVLQMNPQDNTDNLAEDYINMLDTLPSAKRKRFLLGAFSDIVDGALWTEGIINKHRTNVTPHLVKKIVAVDPAITANAQSDETGIILVGLDSDNRGYLLKDKSGIYTPKEWAAIAIQLYRDNNCSYIVGEKNQGGDMVKHTLLTEDNKAVVKLVHASKGKLIRAEPVSILYEDGRISHVGVYPDLEEEMTTFTGQPGEKSPNRLDALVWAFTELLVQERNFFVI